MKKNIFRWLSIFVMAAVCVGFASCGDDDDDVKPGGGPDSGIAVKFQGPKRVFGNNLLKSYVSVGTKYELTYNSDDFVTKITKTNQFGHLDYVYEMTYSDNKVMVAKKGSGREYTGTFIIGSNGFAERVEGKILGESVKFYYDSDGHLTSLSASGGFSGSLTWQDGNIIKESDNDSDTRRTMTYNSTNNIAGLYVNANLGGDMGEFYDDIFYYIGLLGKGTANLVATYTNSSSSSSTTAENSWTLDAAGRPTKCITQVTIRSGSSYSNDTKTYTWNYR